MRQSSWRIDGVEEDGHLNMCLLKLQDHAGIDPTTAASNNYTIEIHVKYHRKSIKNSDSIRFHSCSTKRLWLTKGFCNKLIFSFLRIFTEAPRIPGNDTTSNHSKRGRRSRRGGPSWRRQAPTKTSRKTRHTGEKIRLASWYWKISYSFIH